MLYKTGVGYFEHRGTVRGAQSVTIRFTSAQLNDVLKSLTAIDLGKGQVTGISYNSVAPVEQRLESLRLPLGPRSTIADLLASLRGARIDITSAGAPVTGRLLSVEKQLQCVAAARRQLLQRYTRQLDDQESRLGELQSDRARLVAERASAAARLAEAIESVSFDWKRK